jgi:multidrug efflux system membrane fusion protein
MRFFILIGLLALSGCSERDEAEEVEKAPIPVSVTRVETKDFPVYLETIGTLHPLHFVEIRPQTEGIVKEVHFKEGEWVRKGAPLLTIDSSLYRIKLQQEEAQLAHDQAVWKEAQKKLARYRSLALKNLISQQEREELEADVDKCAALVRVGEARLAATKHELDQCMLLAPIDGVIGKTQLHPGQLITSTDPTPLAVISCMDQLKVELTLPEREFQEVFSALEQGPLAVEICSLYDAKQEAKGMLTFSDHYMDTESGLIQLYGEVPNRPRRFLAGQRVKVRLPLAMIPQAKTVPAKAVHLNQEGPYLFMITPDQRAEMRQVQVAESREGYVILLSGVEAGERAVLEGHLRLSAGDQVDIKADESE